MGVDKMFNGILIEKDEAGYRASYQSLRGDIACRGCDRGGRVVFLNYKDGLALTGAAPWYAASPDPRYRPLPVPCWRASIPDWHPGDKVVLNGWGVGETHSGGLAERARVRGDWLVALPEASSPGTPWPSAPQGTPPCSA